MMGRVSINHGGSGKKTTAVSNAFIESYMATANDVQIKVYLYLLYAMSAHVATDISDLAERFNYSEADIFRAIRHWEKIGLVQTEFDADGVLSHLRIENLIPETRKASVMVTPQQMSVPLREHPAMLTSPVASAPLTSPVASAPLSAPVARTAAEDKARQQIVGVIEQYIGRQLSKKDVETIDFIREELHFSDSLTDYLVQYCVDLGKKQFTYIKTVARDWHDRGITTVEAAVAEAEKFQAAKRERNAKSNTRSVKSTPMEQYKNFPQNRYDFAALEAKVVQN